MLKLALKFQYPNLFGAFQCRCGYLGIGILHGGIIVCSTCGGFHCCLMFGSTSSTSNDCGCTLC